MWELQIFMCNVKFTRFELGAFLDISATRSFIIALKKIQILHPEKPAGNLKQYKYLWEVKQLANLQNLKTSEQLSLWSVY